MIIKISTTKLSKKAIMCDQNRNEIALIGSYLDWRKRKTKQKYLKNQEKFFVCLIGKQKKTFRDDQDDERPEIFVFVSIEMMISLFYLIFFNQFFLFVCLFWCVTNICEYRAISRSTFDGGSKHNKQIMIMMTTTIGFLLIKIVWLWWQRCCRRW